MTYLVVFTGPRASGKSPITKWMEEELGFTRISNDEIGVEKYGPPLELAPDDAESVYRS